MHTRWTFPILGVAQGRGGLRLSECARRFLSSVRLAATAVPAS